ncbi:MAG: hypothetical protein AAFO07_23280 [Bacteroidota bacterium]
MKNLFSRLSLGLGLITLLLLVYIGFFLSREATSILDLFNIPLWAIETSMITGIVGLIVSFISFIRKEPKSWVKITGITLNVALATVYVFAIVSQ